MSVSKNPYRRAAAGAFSLKGLDEILRNSIKDAVAGFVASVVLIGNIVSFGALMFPGDLSSGTSLAI